MRAMRVTRNSSRLVTIHPPAKSTNRDNRTTRPNVSLVESAIPPARPATASRFLRLNLLSFTRSAEATQKNMVTTASCAGASSMTRLSKLITRGSTAINRAATTAVARRATRSTSRKVMTQVAAPSTASSCRNANKVLSVPPCRPEAEDGEPVEVEAGGRVQDEGQSVERHTVTVGDAQRDVGVAGLVDEDVVRRSTVR